jgi:hypothetical protein
MPTFKAMIWNVQNFGSDSDGYTTAKGSNSSVLARFVARVVRHYAADLLIIQEVQQTAGPSLEKVRNALNAGLGTPGWCYDWIKGAFASTKQTIDGPGDLAWNSGNSPSTRRAEGYAVFWNNESGRFSMVPSLLPMSEGVSKDPNYAPNPPLPAHCLELSRFGRVLDSAATFAAASNGFKIDTWKHADFNHSSYPDVSKLNNGSLFWDHVRRPAYCVVRLGPGGGTNRERLCPVIAYHAPSNRTISNTATYVSGLMEQLYITYNLDGNGKPKADDIIYHDRVIAGGDFNLSVSAPNTTNWSWAYSSYSEQFSSNWTAGAQGTPMSTDTAPIQTTVQVNEAVNGIPIGDPIDSINRGAYLSSSIDNVFVRSPANPAARCIHLFDDLFGGPTPLKPAVKLFYDLMLAEQTNAVRKRRGKRFGLSHTLGPLDFAGKPVFRFMQDWKLFLANVKKGEFLDYRPVAEFVHGLVSDHLPVMGSVDW